MKTRTSTRTLTLTRTRTLTSRVASRIIGAASLLALLGCAQTTLATSLVDVAIVNRNTGERLTPYRHDGKLYVAGTPGDAYFVELKSNRGNRVLTVLSVDGINVLTGQSAATLQSGYVIAGGQSYGVTGWRKSMDDVAQFVFTALPDSYAARTGRPGNVGVIGVAVYREKYAPAPVAMAPYSPPLDSWRANRQAKAAAEFARDEAAYPNAPAPSAVPAPVMEAKEKFESSSGSLANLARSDAKDSAAPALADRRTRSSELRIEADVQLKKLGTGHGQREHSPTRYTEFARNSDTPDEVITIYYDSRANLIARGVIPTPRRAEPTPFPASAGFVPDPFG
ncbi:MAG: hypothetical protein KBA96_12100 [Rhodocyclaceae bacterium]|nr:hypothetical protein [Rhodocyclaceae bacterium]